MFSIVNSTCTTTGGTLTATSGNFIVGSANRLAHAAALSVAERIWKQLGAREYAPPTEGGPAAPIRVTASLGLAFYPSKDISSPELLLRFADEALYQAKRAGRNSICLYQAQAYRYEAKG